MDPLHYLGINDLDRAVYDLTANAVQDLVHELATAYVGTLCQAFSGTNPWAPNDAGDIDESITPETPASFTIYDEGNPDDEPR